MSSAAKSVAEMSTISDLYRQGLLVPSTEEDLPSPNQQFNNKICTYQGDITVLNCDAIVNAANSGLRGGGGVDGAIQRAAGPELLRACKPLGGCETGSAKITDAFNLPSKKVIHAVGPVFHSIKDSEPLLRSAYRTSLKLAVENECKTIAFPAISTGVYGYPSKAAARAASREVFAFLKKPEGQKLDKIIFCNFLDKDVKAYAECLPTLFPPTPEDLSHTGEYDLETEESHKEEMPTHEQSSLKEIYEPGQSPRWGVSGDRMNDAASVEQAQDETVEDLSGRRSSSASSKRSWDGEDEASNKRRKEAKDKHDNTPRSRGGYIPALTLKEKQELGILNVVEVDSESSETASMDSRESGDESECSHNHYKRHDGIKSHGLWPMGAMICDCGDKIIQCRGTDVPPVGRGKGSRV